MSAPFDNKNHYISLDKAKKMTKLYRNNRGTAPLTCLSLNETFNVDSIKTLVNTTGAAGIRIYYGMDELKQVHAILVAVNNQNEDILPTVAGVTVAITAPVIVDDAIVCPPTCPPPSPLNS